VQRVQDVSARATRTGTVRLSSHGRLRQHERGGMDKGGATQHDASPPVHATATRITVSQAQRASAYARFAVPSLVCLCQLSATPFVVSLSFTSHPYPTIRWTRCPPGGREEPRPPYRDHPPPAGTFPLAFHLSKPPRRRGPPPSPPPPPPPPALEPDPPSLLLPRVYSFSASVLQNVIKNTEIKFNNDQNRRMGFHVTDGGGRDSILPLTTYIDGTDGR